MMLVTRWLRHRALSSWLRFDDCLGLDSWTYLLSKKVSASTVMLLSIHFCHISNFSEKSNFKYVAVVSQKCSCQMEC